MSGLAVFFLVVPIMLSAWWLFEGWRLRIGRKVVSFSRKTVPSENQLSLSKSYGTLLMALGVFFLVSVYVAIRLRLDATGYGALFMLGSGISMLVTNILDRKHGVQPKR